MEAAGYTLDLYCDAVGHNERDRARGKYNSLDASYYGQTYGEVKRMARSDGWKWVGDKNLCPYCVSYGLNK